MYSMYVFVWFFCYAMQCQLLNIVGRLGMTVMPAKRVVSPPGGGKSARFMYVYDVGIDI